MALPLSKILQSLEQAQTPQELNRAVSAIISSMSTIVVKADLDDDMDEMREGSLAKPREQPNVPASHVRNLLVELILMSKKMASLQNALKAIQSYVDLDINTTIAAATTWIQSQGDATRAEMLYNSDFFAKQPYSIDAKTQLAQALIDTCAQYKVSNGFWEQLVAYQEAAVDFATFQGV